jgi:hypothetical protein
MKPAKKAPQKNFFAENTEITDAIYGTACIYLSLKVITEGNTYHINRYII